MSRDPGTSTSYYSTTLVGLLGACTTYYNHIKSYVNNVRGVTTTPDDSTEVDLDRIWQVNNKIPQDADREAVVKGQEEDRKINKEYVPFVVFTPIVLDTIIKNMVPAEKFEAEYTGVDGRKRKVKTRAITLRVRSKIYVTNWLQALVIIEYLIAATPNTMKFPYYLFNLPHARPEDMSTDGTMSITGPSILKIKNLREDGHLYCIAQDIDLRLTVAVLPPGNQHDNGTTDLDADGTIMKIVEKFNIDIWEGFTKYEENANWMAGARIVKENPTQYMKQPTAADGHVE